MGSPSRLKILPSVPLPTGTVIGAPVSVTLSPRLTPSVASIAIARTRSSPRCCCTSSVKNPSVRPPSGWISIVSAWKISGMWPGKTTSMTTPVTCSTVPTCSFAVLPLSAIRLLRSFQVSDYERPSAPATTSRISWVISACRTRFISRVRSEITSLALSAAFRIAVIRAPCSEAVDSSSAR